MEPFEVNWFSPSIRSRINSHIKRMMSNTYLWKFFCEVEWKHLTWTARAFASGPGPTVIEKWSVVLFCDTVVRNFNGCYSTLHVSFQAASPPKFDVELQILLAYASFVLQGQQRAYYNWALGKKRWASLNWPKQPSPTQCSPCQKTVSGGPATCWCWSFHALNGIDRDEWDRFLSTSLTQTRGCLLFLFPGKSKTPATMARVPSTTVTDVFISIFPTNISAGIFLDRSTTALGDKHLLPIPPPNSSGCSMRTARVAGRGGLFGFYCETFVVEVNGNIWHLLLQA